MSAQKIQLHQFRMHLPRRSRHADTAFESGTATGPLAKPFVSNTGRSGFLAMLPDVYERTTTLVRSHVLATMRGKSGHLPGTNVSLPQQRDVLIERLADQMPGCTFDMTHFGAVVTTPFTTLAIEQQERLLTVALPRVSGLDQDDLPPLRAYAARLAFDAPFSRLEVDATSCRHCVHLPHPPLDRLAATVAFACHALLALAHSIPPLSIVVAPEYRPLLELAGSGHWSAVVSSTR